MEILTLILDIPLHPGDISAFRASVIELAGREHLLFHNHEGEEAHYRWAYPLIQYGVRKGHAAITGLGEGAKLMRTELLPRLPQKWTFAGRQYKLSGCYLDLRTYHWSLYAEPKRYGLYQWLALSRENYALWKNRKDGQAVLSQALTGHLRSLAEATGFPHVEEVKGEVLEVHRIKRVKWRDTHLIAFDALISSNMGLPMHLGLGRSVAFGFGELLPLPVYKKWIARRPGSTKKTVETED